ncbi:helix-turn-helix transcriptional regulator [Hydrogenophaga sp.]|uniref:helix-turn-helix transcriptional regulator n=1 Tax=Hydrogenophaga sp. TaxID=1904254 RepID=UPI003D2956E2
MNTETFESNVAVTRLKKADVCAELGISQRTLDNLVQRNEFPPGVRIGKWSYWSSKAIENFRERAFSMQENWTPMQASMQTRGTRRR